MKSLASILRQGHALVAQDWELPRSAVRATSTGANVEVFLAVGAVVATMVTILCLAKCPCKTRSGSESSSADGSDRQHDGFEITLTHGLPASPRLGPAAAVALSLLPRAPHLRSADFLLPDGTAVLQAATEKGTFCRLLPVGSVRDYDGTCPICIEYFRNEDTVVFMPCSHAIHFECCKLWFSKSASLKCPLCRADLCTDASVSQAVR